jgi:hypothetical protein
MEDKNNPRKKIPKNSKISQKTPAVDPNPEWKIFVGGLEDNVRSPQLKDEFQKYPDLKDAHVVMRTDNPEMSRRFGFLTFATEESFASVLLHKDFAINGKVRELFCIHFLNSGLLHKDLVFAINGKVSEIFCILNSHFEFWFAA